MAPFAMIAFAALRSMRAKPVKLPKSDMRDMRDMRDMPALNQPAEAQTIMLVEAAMLGYSPARNGDRARA